MTTHPSGPPSAAEIPDSVTHREVQEILRAFAASGWAEMDLTVHGMRIVVGKNAPPASFVTSDSPGPIGHRSSDVAVKPPSGAAAPLGTSDRAGPIGHGMSDVVGLGTGGRGEAGLVEVRSPTVGAFWVAPGPGQPPFVEVGQHVARDEQLAIVEVMKLMNPVVAPGAGEVVEVCAANSESVEFDQVLFRIRPTDPATSDEAGAIEPDASDVPRGAQP